MKNFVYLILFLFSIGSNKTLACFEFDTLIYKNTTLRLHYEFPIFECGLNVHRHPSNAKLSELVYEEGSLTEATYTYIPNDNFTGYDTVVIFTGCISESGEIVGTYVDYIINVVDYLTDIFYYDESYCANPWITAESTPQEDKRDSIGEFLTDNGISYDTIEFSLVYGLAELCKACNCLSGSRVFVTAPDNYKDQLEKIGFKEYPDTLSKYIKLSYFETQCSDPWDLTMTPYPPAPGTRLFLLAGYLNNLGIEFVYLEMILAINLELVDLCAACDCGNGYRFDIYVTKEYVSELVKIGFKRDCSPIASFTYRVMKSYPERIDLINTAEDIDSVVWLAKSLKTEKDTVIARCDSFRIMNPYEFYKEIVYCFEAPCPSFLPIGQVVYNACGTDTLWQSIDLLDYTYIQNQKSIQIEYLIHYSENTIILKSKNGESLGYKIINLLGQEVNTGMINGNTEVNIGKGIYVILIYNNGSVCYKQKIIIE